MGRALVSPSFPVSVFHRAYPHNFHTAKIATEIDTVCPLEIALLSDKYLYLGTVTFG
jgi:hypothetical protein